MKPGVKRRIGIADTHGNRRVTVSACLELVLSQVPSLMDQVLDGLRLQRVWTRTNRRAGAGFGRN
jgi:hypothetical protein